MKPYNGAADTKTGDASTGSCINLSINISNSFEPGEIPVILMPPGGLELECKEDLTEFFNGQNSSTTAESKYEEFPSGSVQFTSEPPPFLRGSPSTFFQSPRTYTAQLEGKLQTFYLEEIPDDGDCGFVAIDMTRTEAIRILTEAKGDENIRQVISKEISNSLMVGQLSRLQTAEYKSKSQKINDANKNVREILTLVKGNSDAKLEGDIDNCIQILVNQNNKEYSAQLAVLRAAKKNLETVEAELDAYLSSEPVYLSYIDEYNRSLWAGRKLLIALGLKTQTPREIYFWQEDPNKEDHLVSLEHHPNPRVEGRKVYHLLYRNDGHFDRLLTQPPRQEEKKRQEQDVDLLIEKAYEAQLKGYHKLSSDISEASRCFFQASQLFSDGLTLLLEDKDHDDLKIYTDEMHLSELLHYECLLKSDNLLRSDDKQVEFDVIFDRAADVIQVNDLSDDVMLRQYIQAMIVYRLVMQRNSDLETAIDILKSHYAKYYQQFFEYKADDVSQEHYINGRITVVIAWQLINLYCSCNDQVRVRKMVADIISLQQKIYKIDACLEQENDFTIPIEIMPDFIPILLLSVLRRVNLNNICNEIKCFENINDAEKGPYAICFTILEFMLDVNKNPGYHKKEIKTRLDKCQGELKANKYLEPCLAHKLQLCLNEIWIKKLMGPSKEARESKKSKELRSSPVISGAAAKKHKSTPAQSVKHEQEIKEVKANGVAETKFYTTQSYPAMFSASSSSSPNPTAKRQKTAPEEAAQSSRSTQSLQNTL